MKRITIIIATLAAILLTLPTMAIEDANWSKAVETHYKTYGKDPQPRDAARQADLTKRLDALDEQMRTLRANGNPPWTNLFTLYREKSDTYVEFKQFSGGLLYCNAALYLLNESLPEAESFQYRIPVLEKKLVCLNVLQKKGEASIVSKKLETLRAAVGKTSPATEANKTGGAESSGAAEEVKGAVKDATTDIAEPLVKDDTVVRAEPASTAKDAPSPVDPLVKDDTAPSSTTKESPTPAKKDADTEVVTATGTGTTTDKATKNALRHAVDMVVSSLIDAKTIIENDEIIKDGILQLSRGGVSDYETVRTWKEDDLVYVKVKATVKKNDLATMLEEKKLYVAKVDSSSLVKDIAKVEIKQDNAENAKEYIANTLKPFPACVIKAELVGRPEVVKKEGEGDAAIATVKATIKVSVDEKLWKDFTDQLCKGLDKMAVKKDRGEAKVANLKDSTSHIVVQSPGLPLRDPSGPKTPETEELLFSPTYHDGALLIYRSLDLANGMAPYTMYKPADVGGTDVADAQTRKMSVRYSFFTSVGDEMISATLPTACQRFYTTSYDKSFVPLFVVFTNKRGGSCCPSLTRWATYNITVRLPASTIKDIAKVTFAVENDNDNTRRRDE